MNLEFTGERVVPGQVDQDLWNEHIARYAFAARLARMKRVLDAGCGTGYGSAELAKHALHVTGVDFSEDAVNAAAETYKALNLEFRVGRCEALPGDDGAFDLVVAFEVIEHLADWRSLLTEARRLLSPGGQFVVSTPNKSYYADQRDKTGPNPFHEHEFEFAEFEAALKDVFPHVTMFLQNHSAGIVFQPHRPWLSASSAELRLEPVSGTESEAHFYLAVCALAPMTGAPTFVYLPSSANVLRERELHIGRLEAELEQKNAWLEESKNRHAELVAIHDDQTGQLQKQGEWAQQLDAQLKTAHSRINELQEELDKQQATGRAAVESYEAELRRLEAELDSRHAAAVALERRLQTELDAKCAELAKCVDLLHTAESTIEERTKWALQLQQEGAHLRSRLEAARASRWIRLGRIAGIGPELSA